MGGVSGRRGSPKQRPTLPSCFPTRCARRRVSLPSQPWPVVRAAGLTLGVTLAKRRIASGISKRASRAQARSGLPFSRVWP